jgi:hypothetical protein
VQRDEPIGEARSSPSECQCLRLREHACIYAMNVRRGKQLAELQGEARSFVARGSWTGRTWHSSASERAYHPSIPPSPTSAIRQQQTTAQNKADYGILGILESYE